MSFRSVIKIALIVAIVALSVVASEPIGLAQCSMCRASLAGSGNAAFIKQFNLGVLVLLVPPVAMFCSIFVILRRANVSDDAERSEEDSGR
jgi:hypothetical protein